MSQERNSKDWSSFGLVQSNTLIGAVRYIDKKLHHRNEALVRENVLFSEVGEIGPGQLEDTLSLRACYRHPQSLYKH